MRLEDLRVGMELPNREHSPGPRELVLFASGSGDYNEIHYDSGAAKAAGLDGVIVHGRLKAAYLTKFVLDCVTPAPRLRSFKVRFSGTDLVSEPMTLGGAVRAMASLEDDPLKYEVVVDLWIKDRSGKPTTSATATLIVDKGVTHP